MDNDDEHFSENWCRVDSSDIRLQAELYLQQEMIVRIDDKT